MIKGHSIDELFIIRDTTPGQMPVWIMVIMLFGIYICYQCTYLYWSKKKVERLKEYQKIIEKGPLGSCGKKELKNGRNIPETDNKPVHHQIREKQEEEEQAEDDAMEIFNNLKHYRNH